jgi:hypothetical protein
VWPVQMKTPAARARKVTDLLGDDHDLAVLLAVIESSAATIPADAVSALRNVVNRRRAELQSSAKSLGSKLYVQTSAAFSSAVRNRNTRA